MQYKPFRRVFKLAQEGQKVARPSGKQECRTRWEGRDTEALLTALVQNCRCPSHMQLTQFLYERVNCQRASKGKLGSNLSGAIRTVVVVSYLPTYPCLSLELTVQKGLACIPSTGTKCSLLCLSLTYRILLTQLGRTENTAKSPTRQRHAFLI